MTLLKRCAILAFLILWAVPAGTVFAGIEKGKPVPNFSLKDTKGKTYDLGSAKASSMMILYFFDAASRPSQEFLLTIDSLANKYQAAGLTVWGITSSPKDKVNAFVQKASPGFPILMDSARVSDAYNARLILPTTCIVGPGFKLLDYFQGGGKSTNAMLVKLAERTLQQNQPKLAGAISDHVVKSDPKNGKARMVKGYAALKAGQVSDAEKTFSALSREKGQEKILGKEGLAGVYAFKGENDKALKLADEVQKKAPERSYAYVIKGDVLYSKDKAKAEEQYRNAVEKKEAEDFQKAAAYNKLGRLYAGAGKYDQSRQLYDRAVALDPYYVEAMTNKGMTYEKQGDWSKALDEYRQGQAVNRDDVFAGALAKRASEMLAYQGDAKQKERIDKLVKELSERYRSQDKASAKTEEDTWTSKPMVISFVDFQETGVLSDRDGFSTVFTTQLADQLNASGRVRVVERVLVERLLEELNIGSSELADPATSLKLGKVLAAKLMGTGTILHLSGGSMMSLRLIDTETSAIPHVIIRQIPQASPLKKELGSLGREVLASIMQNYPLHAYVVNADEKQVMINLGANQGVVSGTAFEVIEEKAAVEYKGKKLQSAPETVAKLEVVKVEPDLSYCRIVEKKRDIKRDDKAVEKIDEALVKG
ncbi:MAG TPA: tetratricopeptide repeat protein [Deltaproteobacteria bacterium]|nr:tetratricopeptide repeat protein [Deltaproteobacteria bacterium]HQI00918.1 tetratricopeptide repeat protein [Deltaproteobacteria bacterium]